MNATTIAVDLAKTVFELVIADEQGRRVERKRLSREGFARFFANRPPRRIVMEACATAHHWARSADERGASAAEQSGGKFAKANLMAL